jgi:hypothetical protein
MMDADLIFFRFFEIFRTISFTSVSKLISGFHPSRSCAFRGSPEVFQLPWDENTGIDFDDDRFFF